MFSTSSVPRITTPTPTRGPGPSHSPPDARYAPGLQLARALGWFGVGLGLAEVLAPARLEKVTGVDRSVLIAFGLREIASGLAILGCTRPAGWMWTRVAGDALDLGALGSSLLDADGRRRGGVLASMAAVAGVTVLDVIASTQLSAAAALEG